MGDTWFFIENSTTTSEFKKLCQQEDAKIDDIDVYLRLVTYEERITRNTEKFIQRVKLTPLSHRFEIY